MSLAALAQQDVRHQAAAHADLAVDAPDRERNAFAFERFLPGEHVLVDAVDERAVEIEQECGLRRVHAHGSMRDDMVVDRCAADLPRTRRRQRRDR